MSNVKTQIGNLRYNPVAECFEALVTMHLPVGRVRVPSQFPAPLTADFDAASDGLLRAALRNLARPGAIQSWLVDPATPPQTDAWPELPRAA